MELFNIFKHSFERQGLPVTTHHDTVIGNIVNQHRMSVQIAPKPLTFIDLNFDDDGKTICEMEIALRVMNDPDDPDIIMLDNEEFACHRMALLEKEGSEKVKAYLNEHDKHREFFMQSAPKIEHIVGVPDEAYQILCEALLQLWMVYLDESDLPDWLKPYQTMRF